MKEYDFVLSSQDRKKEIINNLNLFKKRDLFYKIDTEINNFIKDPSNKRIYLFYGLRGIGKSTILYQILKKHNSIMFIDGTNINYNNLDLVKVVDEYRKITNYNILIIDELNDINNWGDALKIIHDLYNIKIICTGSSTIKISKDLDKIIRRSRLEKIPPLFFKEFLHLKYDINIDLNKSIRDLLFSDPKDGFVKAKAINNEILEKDSHIFEHFQEYMKFGYPYKNFF